MTGGFLHLFVQGLSVSQVVKEATIPEESVDYNEVVHWCVLDPIKNLGRLLLLVFPVFGKCYQVRMKSSFVLLRNYLWGKKASYL